MSRSNNALHATPLALRARGSLAALGARERERWAPEMKWLPCLALGISVVVSGCSWITTFAVVNASPAPITVSYEIGAVGSKRPGCPVMTPRVAPANDVELLKGFKDKAPAAKYACDSALSAVTITVEPEQAISLFQAGTYTGFDSEREQYIGVSKLSIKGERGELQYVGRQITRDFMKEDNSLYVLTYQ